MAVKRIISEKQRKELKKKNSNNEQKIQARIRRLAVDSLIADKELSKDYI